MEDIEMYHQLEHGIKYMRHQDIIKRVQKKIIECTINNFIFFNLIQVQIIDAISNDDQLFVKKYASVIRELLDEGYTIDKIILNILEKEEQDRIQKDL